MKTFCLFVLVLLTMLLPLRGVSAAALLCEQQPSSHAVASAHDHEMAGASSDDHSQHDHSDIDIDIDKNHHCLSSCAAPLLMEMPSVAAPAATGTTVFPHLAAPAPTFLSDGQERPPRSI